MREIPQGEIPIRHRDDGGPDGPARPLPERSGMVLLFEEWAAKAPDRAAVVDREGTVSYGELNAAADLLARRLIEAGVARRRVASLHTPASSAVSNGAVPDGAPAHGTVANPASYATADGAVTHGAGTSPTTHGTTGGTTAHEAVAHEAVAHGAGANNATENGVVASPAAHAGANGAAGPVSDAASPAAHRTGSPAAGVADRARCGAGGASVAGRTGGTTPAARIPNGAADREDAPALGDTLAERPAYGITAERPADDIGDRNAASTADGTRDTADTMGGTRTTGDTAGATGDTISATDDTTAAIGDTTGATAGAIRAPQSGETSDEMSTGSHGGAAGEVVAILAGRTAGTMAGMLAAMKAGAAYLPLDPEYPASRLELVLRDSGARTVLVPDGLRERLPAFDGTVLELPVFGRSQTPDMARTAAN